MGKHAERLLTASHKAPHMSPFFCFALAAFQKHLQNVSIFIFFPLEKRGTHLKRLLFPSLSKGIP